MEVVINTQTLGTLNTFDRKIITGRYNWNDENLYKREKKAKNNTETYNETEMLGKMKP